MLNLKIRMRLKVQIAGLREEVRLIGKVNRNQQALPREKKKRKKAKGLKGKRRNKNQRRRKRTRSVGSIQTVQVATQARIPVILPTGLSMIKTWITAHLIKSQKVVTIGKVAAKNCMTQTIRLITR